MHFCPANYAVWNDLRNAHGILFSDDDYATKNTDRKMLLATIDMHHRHDQSSFKHDDCTICFFLDISVKLNQNVALSYCNYSTIGTHFKG